MLYHVSRATDLDTINQDVAGLVDDIYALIQFSHHVHTCVQASWSPVPEACLYWLPLNVVYYATLVELAGTASPCGTGHGGFAIGE